jgi:serine/threonine-protein kinase
MQKKPAEQDADWQNRKADLLREGQRLRDAEHNRVVRVFQVLERKSQDAIVLVMEFCEGGSLQAHFESGPMSLSILRSALTDAALGLQVVHSRGMLHRDIKPGNILLDGRGRAKLGDFGLVTDNLLFGYAAGEGYLDHLAKEVYDRGVTSIRSDIWALGMTAYRLMHGQTFYNELPNPRTLIPQGGFALNLPWLPHIPSEWRRFVRQAMNDNPKNRFQTAAQMLQAIERLPVTPEWICDYTPQEVYWSRAHHNREIRVTWKKHSARKHEWEARSVPLVEGRERRLGCSEGVIGKTKVLAELLAFFEGCR